MTHPLRTTWIRKLSIALFAGTMLFTGTASAQNTVFGIPIPSVERGPNNTVTITLTPDGPPINVPVPSLPQAPGAPAPWAPTPWAPAPQAPAPQAPAPAAPAPQAAPPFAVPTLPPAANPATPATPGQGGQLYGVFVGITDYPSANDLPFCADDAHRVQRAFLNAGLMRSEDTVVLTDHAATRTNMANAIERFNRMAGPNDTLVFFFSGHGNQIPDQDGDEADGTDETILLADGPVTDDEMRALLEPGQARDFVALDSCYSGGFASDIARLGNSVGFYASREDQVSYVAGEFQAGGYLSYYLAQNINRMGGRPIPMWELQRDLRSDFDQSGTTQRQELTVGVSRSVNTRTVLFDTPNQQPAMVAVR